MGSTHPVIVKVAAPKRGKITIETSDGFRYHADLSPLSRVYCYPKSNKEWAAVSIDDFGTALIWKNRFEVHVDQIVGLAKKVERPSFSRAA